MENCCHEMTSRKTNLAIAQILSFLIFVHQYHWQFVFVCVVKSVFFLSFCSINNRLMITFFRRMKIIFVIVKPNNSVDGCLRMHWQHLIEFWNFSNDWSGSINLFLYQCKNINCELVRPFQNFHLIFVRAFSKQKRHECC